MSSEPEQDARFWSTLNGARDLRKLISKKLLETFKTVNCGKSSSHNSPGRLLRRLTVPLKRKF